MSNPNLIMDVDPTIAGAATAPGGNSRAPGWSLRAFALDGEGCSVANRAAPVARRRRARSTFSRSRRRGASSRATERGASQSRETDQHHRPGRGLGDAGDDDAVQAKRGGVACGERDIIDSAVASDRRGTRRADLARDGERWTGSFDPQREINRAKQRPIEVAGLFGSPARGNHLGQQPRLHQQAGHMHASQRMPENHPPDLASKGPSTQASLRSQ
jgi:hypothetical protein